MTSEAELTKEKIEYYRHYTKFMEMKLEQSMAKTTEYQVFANRYPHLAESIRLKREMERLKKKLKSKKERSSRSQVKREMNDIRARLRKQSILKRLRGESKQETIFHTHFLIARASFVSHEMQQKVAMVNVQESSSVPL